MNGGQTIESARALYQSGRLQEAGASCRLVLEREPDNAEALVLLGGVTLLTETAASAVEILSRATTLNTRNAFAFSLLGNALMQQGDPPQALANYDRAIEISPEYADAYYNRGCALLDLGQIDKAVQDFKAVLRLNPEFTGAYHNLAIALAGADRLQEAMPFFDQAIAKAPSESLFRYNRGRARQQMLQFEAAVSDYSAAIELQPAYAAAYVNRGMSLLTLGRLLEGWSDLEWRWAPGGSSLAINRRQLPVPQWRGETPLTGQSILLHSEQGLGDTLQFCRYAPLVAALGAKVILEAPAELQTLLNSLDGIEQLISPGEPIPEVQWHCPLMSLPLAFRTAVESVPARVPYLKGDTARSDLWQQKLGPRQGLRVGLVWSGGYRADRPDLWAVNSRRNIPFEKLAALKLNGVDYFSLQKGMPAEGELADVVSRGWSGPAIRDLGPQLHDFADTAAVIELLDLVISVDTSVAHLAGALGKPLWLLNRHDNCWRWMRHRSDSPWYPTARIFRQGTPGNWDEPLQEVRTRLKQLLHTSAGVTLQNGQ